MSINREGVEGNGWHTFAGALIVLVAAALLFIGGRALLAAASQQVLAAVIPAVFAVVALIWSNIYQQRKQIEQQQRQKKAEVYEAFMHYWFRVMRLERKELPEDEREKMDQEYYTTVSPKLIAWASEDFLKAYATHAAPTESPPEEDYSIFDFEKMFFLVRSDLGYSDNDPQSGALLKTFLTGVDEVLEERRDVEE